MGDRLAYSVLLHFRNAVQGVSAVEIQAQSDGEICFLYHLIKTLVKMCRAEDTAAFTPLGLVCSSRMYATFGLSCRFPIQTCVVDSSASFVLNSLSAAFQGVHDHFRRAIARRAPAL